MENLSGKQFGYWIVLDEHTVNEQGSMLYFCYRNMEIKEQTQVFVTVPYYFRM